MRELENRLKRAALLTEDKFVTAAGLGLASAQDRSFPTLRQARAEAEIDVVRRALAVSNYNISQAAKLLGVSRPTLYDVMATHNFSLERANGVTTQAENNVVDK